MCINGSAFLPLHSDRVYHALVFTGRRRTCCFHGMHETPCTLLFNHTHTHHVHSLSQWSHCVMLNSIYFYGRPQCLSAHCIFYRLQHLLYERSNKTFYLKPPFRLTQYTRLQKDI